MAELTDSNATTANDESLVVIADGAGGGAQAQVVTRPDTKKALAVDATTAAGGSASIPSFSNTLRYEDMNVANGGVARNTNISSTLTNVFSYSGSGLVIGFEVFLEKILEGWTIQLLIDGVNVFSSAGLLVVEYVSTPFDLSEDRIRYPLLGFHTKGEHFRFQSPMHYPIRYTSSVVVKAKKTGTTQSFRAGFIVLTKDT